MRLFTSVYSVLILLSILVVGGLVVANKLMARTVPTRVAMTFNCEPSRHPLIGFPLELSYCPKDGIDYHSAAACEQACR